MVRGGPALLLLVVFEHREVDHPQRVVAGRVDQPEALRELEPQRAERLGGDRGAVGDEQQQVTVARAQLGVDRRDLLRAEELRQVAPPAPLADADGSHRLRAVALDELAQAILLGA